MTAVLIAAVWVSLLAAGLCFGRVSADADLRAETIHTERHER